MESVLVFINELWHSIPLSGSYILLLILMVFAGIHFYSLSREKKELLRVVDNKVKIFQKAFDISEDAVLILSENNEIVYANKTMQKLLSLPEDYMFKPLKNIPQVKIKSEWVGLDTLIEHEYKKTDEKMLSYLQTCLSMNNPTDQEIPVNLYIDSSLLESKHDMWCNIVSIHDLRQKAKEKSLKYQHQLTSLPNQNQLLHDLNALYSKTHLKKQKVALVLLDIDDLSNLRATLGYEQINAIVLKFTKYLQTLSQELEMGIYHTYYNNFFDHTFWPQQGRRSDLACQADTETIGIFL